MQTDVASYKPPADALQFLKADHDDAAAMFRDYDRLCHEGGDATARLTLAGSICTALLMHLHLEEELFYPAVREALGDAALLDEAQVEHASAQHLINLVETSDPDSGLYDARVHVLGQYVQHHVREEEQELFPRVRESTLDLRELGARLAERKEDLLEELLDEAAIRESSTWPED